MEIVKIKKVSKIYKLGSEKVVALDAVDLVIERGEICCFCGTSGSGKSTLLHLMAGLERPTKGEIKIGKYNIGKMSEKKLALFRQKHVGFIFQSYNLLPSLTAQENVALPLIFKGVPKSQREEKARKMLKDVNLGDRMRHKPTQMSGGQQQRVGIARAFVALPEIVFADEPTGNLDSKTTQEVMQLIVSIAKENKQTLVLVTHDLQIAAYADRVIHLFDGRIEKIVMNDTVNNKVQEEFVNEH